MSTAASPPVDLDRLNEFVGRVVGEIGASLNTALVVIGDQLGLYKAMAGAGPLTPAELATRTGTSERYVREWLNAQAAGDFVAYDAATGTFTLPPEQAMALTDENSPAFLAGFFQVAAGTVRDAPKIAAAFRSGDGVGWHQHDHDVFEGTERFFRPGYQANLVSAWIPALDGVEDKLKIGAKVADIGCGHGASTILMAQAYPKSEFFGFDYHGESIDTACRRAATANVGNRVSFEAVPADGYPGNGYDLVTTFDCLHDMGDPVGAARHVLSSLDSDGTWMIVEPFAGDHLEDNINPVGRAYYAFSTLLCTPASLSQPVGLALGAQAGEGRLGAVVREGGFTRFRRATETPFNLILEARP
jgi:SAM-dependent methyltransferase